MEAEKLFGDVLTVLNSTLSVSPLCHQQSHTTGGGHGGSHSAASSATSSATPRVTSADISRLEGYKIAIHWIFWYWRFWYEICCPDARNLTENCFSVCPVSDLIDAVQYFS